MLIVIIMIIIIIPHWTYVVCNLILSKLAYVTEFGSFDVCCLTNTCTACNVITFDQTLTIAWKEDKYTFLLKSL